MSRSLGWVGILAVETLASCAASLPQVGSVSLEQRLAAHPEDPALNLALGEQAETGGELLRAEQYYLRAEALGTPSGAVVPRLIRVLVAAHRYDEALGRCRRQLASDPTDRPTRFLVAALLIALDQPAQAKQELANLMRGDPRDPEPYLTLGRLYLRTDRQRARPLLERYLLLAPDGSAAPEVRFELAGDGDQAR